MSKLLHELTNYLSKSLNLWLNFRESSPPTLLLKRRGELENNKNMSLKIGIVGLPNVGKSTLFQTITKKQVDVANYPFCTIEPNIGVVAVPDERVDKLADFFYSKKRIYTTIEFVDIAGLVKGANQGEGLGNKFLANIRETDAIVYVLRAFKNEKIINTQSDINPISDKEILDTELILKDLETVNKRLQDLQKDIKSGKKETLLEIATLTKLKDYLGRGMIIYEQIWGEEERKYINNYQLLTSKARLYLLNGENKEIPQNIIDFFTKNNWPFLIIDILAESNANDLTKEERTALGLPIESGLDLLIKEAYEILNLITFLTTGEDETRAWTIKGGQRAPQAGGAIHTDFEKKFIKADTINWQTLLSAGGYVRAKERGLIRSEGKEYIIQDGDVIEIKHSP